MTDKRRVVKDMADLKKIIEENGGAGEFYIMLNGGGRSSKLINHYPKNGSWFIFNEIDSSDQEIANDEELGQKTHIVEALEKNALVWWGY